jgi:predicted acyltransferase
MPPAPLPGRIASLDQFRGYTVLGMFVVNFLGSFAVVPEILKHHADHVTYADTIMPGFFFAAGFSYRLTFLRRLASGVSPGAARLAALRRSLGLILIGIVVYHLDGSTRTWADLQGLGVRGFLAQAFQRMPFQALVHIGVTSIWVLPVIGARAPALVLFTALSAALHAWASSAGYFDWVMTRPGIDGGPLGFLTWTIPMLAGALAHDAVVRGVLRPAAPIRLLAVGTIVMLLGYALSRLGVILDASPGSALLADPPFRPPTGVTGMWTMSQRAGSVSYLVFGAGFSLALYGLFVHACDVRGFGLGLLDTLGRNALAGYILHLLVDDAVKPYAPGDAPLPFVLFAFGVYLGITWIFLRFLEKRGIFIRL